MLSSISWQAYLLVIMICLLVYYGYVGYIYYRAEARSFIQRLQFMPKNDHATPTAGFIASDDIIGAIQQDEVQFVNMDEIDFGPDDENDERETKGQKISVPVIQDPNLLGEVSAVITDCQTLIHLFARAPEPKDKFLGLLRQIVRKHPLLEGTTYTDGISRFLAGQCNDNLPYEVSLPELEAIWNN